MSRRKRAIGAAVLDAPPVALSDAIEGLPMDGKAFNSIRYRWIQIVRGHPMLTAAEKHVGLAIAQQHINRSPGHHWFNSAWAAHRTIADEIGLTRRTVVSAMAALRQLGLIAIEPGGGWKVPGGRTDRYTLRIDWLDVLERAAEIVRQKDVKIVHRSNHAIDGQFDERCEKNAERGEIEGREMRNSPNGDVKGLHTTISDTTFLEGLTTRVEPSPEALPLAATPQASNGRKESSERITAQDHLALAELLGEGNVESGYFRMSCLNDGDADTLALRYRLNRSAGRDVLAEAERLEENIGRSD